MGDNGTIDPAALQHRLDEIEAKRIEQEHGTVARVINLWQFGGQSSEPDKSQSAEMRRHAARSAFVWGFFTCGARVGITAGALADLILAWWANALFEKQNELI